MESRNLIKQLKPIAHVFGGENHRQMKTKILNRLGLIITQSNFVFMGAVLLIGSVLSLKVSLEYLALALMAITIICLTLLPLLLSVSWNKVSISLLVLCCVFAYSIFEVTSWIGKNGAERLLSIDVLMFLILCISVRAVAQLYFWKRPVERLFKSS